MNEAQTLALKPETDEDSNDLELVDVFLAFAKHKKKILGIPIAAALVALAVSFALPSIYKANTKLLPPQQAQSSAAAMLSQLGAVGAMTGLGGVKNPNDMYVGMLRSRTVADKLIAKYELSKVYDKATMEKTREKLLENSSIVAGKDGLISIDVEDTDPSRAAGMANAYVDELLTLTKVLAVTEASRRRVFFERQLELAKDNLAKAEMTLRSALDQRGVISVDAESVAIVETAGRLRAQIAAKEIEISSMQAFLTTSNPEYRRAQEELSSLQAQLNKLRNGRADEASESGATDKQGLENIKVLRDVKYYQMLYELLAKQYEVARLDEAKEPSVVQVLDPAIKPERPIRPRRLFLVAISAAVALLGVLAWVLVAARNERMPQLPEQAEKWKKLKSYF